MEIKDIENKAKKMKENEKEDKFHLVNNYESDKNKSMNSKMRDDLKDYIMDHRRLMYQRLEGMEPEEINSSDDIKNTNDIIEINNNHCDNCKNNKNKTNKKIGTNIVLFKKYVLGTKNNILLLISTVSGMAITWFGWAITNGSFYSLRTYIICFISYFLTSFFMVLCFLTEPGIIPKECPKFSPKLFEEKKKEEKEKEKSDNENIKDKKEENNENKETIPRIFKERLCSTCNIIRPPKSSHCRECNNCVQNFDHHCFFISNCVGKRNHKFFFLFLICGTIGSVKMVILGFFTIYNVFITNRKETIYLFIKEDKKLFIICSSLLAICLLFILFNPRSFCCTVVPGLIGLGIMFHLWYKHLHHKTNLPDYFNCFLLPFYIGSWSFFFFVVCTFFQQLCYISSGYTIKQTKSIEEEIIDINNNSNRQKIKSEYIRNKTFGEKINNIITFLKAERGESLIVPERDLIP